MNQSTRLSQKQHVKPLKLNDYDKRELHHQQDRQPQDSLPLLGTGEEIYRHYFCPEVLRQGLRHPSECDGSQCPYSPRTEERDVEPPHDENILTK